MALYKTEKQLEFNKEGFHASHVVNSTLSIIPVFSEVKDKSPKEDHIIFTVTTKERGDKIERSASISLDVKQLKQIRNVLDVYLKTIKE